MIYDSENNVCGVITKASGISKANQRKSNYSPGIELIAKQTIFAEGCRGSCTEAVIERFNLREGKIRCSGERID